MPPPSSIASTPVRVAVVEDDAACRTALAHALQGASDMRLAWTAASRTEAMAALAQDDAAPLDVLLLDLGLPDGSGLDVLAALRARWPQAAAMVSTIFGDEVHVLDAIAAGAMGYLLKDLPATAVVDEVRSLHAGGSPINPMVARKLLLLRQTQPALAAAPPRRRAQAWAQAHPRPRARPNCCAWWRAAIRWTRSPAQWASRATPCAPLCDAYMPSCRSPRRPRP